MSTTPDFSPRAVNRAPAPRPTTQMAIGCFFIPLIVAVLSVGAFFYFQSKAISEFTVPDGKVILIHAAPDETSPLMARFGAGQTLPITGRTADWDWLEVQLWDNRTGWTLRPLDVLPGQLSASERVPVLPAPEDIPAPVTLNPEEMVDIAATTFTMGSPPGQGDADEHPAHPVSLSTFKIDRTEVTLGHYWQCALAGNCAAPHSETVRFNTHYVNDPSFDNHPVVGIPWEEAGNYCAWRGKRLPTEAEWEMAAGWNDELGAKFTWPWGSSPIQGEGNVGEASADKPVEVGSFATDKSPAGLMDMAGNVNEWVFDWYKIDYYNISDNSNPRGPTHRRGEGTGRVVRGGSFQDSLERARTTNRESQQPDYGYPTIGFRCVKSVK